MRSVFAALLIAAALTGCETVENPVTGKAERTVMDEASEIAEGAKAHPAVVAEYGEYKDPKVAAYVDRIGQRLASQSHRSDLKWHFTVLDSPEINAFALPGGYIYVTRGLMAYMESEADLAGVIGHEIGHVTARHGAQRATRQQTAGLGVMAATVLGAILEGRGVGGAGQLAQQVSQGVAAGYIARYSREQELQADQLGAEYLARTNLNPSNMVDVIGVLASQERFAADAARAEGRAPQAEAGWLASHPSNDQRLREIREIAAKYRGQYADDGRARYLQAINGMPFGESREHGVTRGRNFYHEPLGFAITAPQGWRIHNAADALTLANAQGTAALVLRAVPPQAGGSHEEIIRNVIRPEEGRTESRRLNGLPATHFVGTRRTEQGARPVVATVATGPGERHYLLVYGASDAATLQRAYAQLQQAESTFRALGPADRGAARPWSLRMVPMPRGGFAELAQRSPLTTQPQQQLRLLNGVYGGGSQPPPGQLVKTVE